MSELTLRLQTSTGSSVLPNVPAATSFADFCLLVASHLGAATTDFQLLSGFPPRPLQLQPGDSIGGALQNGDSVRVKFASEAAAAAPKPGTGKPPGAPPAAGKKKATSKAGAAPAPATKPRAANGPVIHSLSGPVSLGAASASSGGSATASASPAAAKKRKRTTIAMRSEEDVAGLMLEAVSGGTGKQNKFMRAVFKRAVEKEYDAAKAQARVSAALASKYEMRDSQNARRLGDGQPTALHVKFKKGIHSRSYFEETVDLLTEDALRAVALLVLHNPDPDSKEMLKPMNMAGCSPRVFWSLVRLYGGDVVDGLRRLLPDQDWSFLDERQRFLSEKAKANAEQEMERKLAAEARKAKRRQRMEERQKRQRTEGADEADAHTKVQEAKEQNGENEANGKEEGAEEEEQEDEGEQSDEELGIEEAKEELEEFVPAELLDYVVSDRVGIRCLRALTKREPEELQAQLAQAGAACTEEQVQEIVTKAREQSLDEIWYQICHQNDTLVELLEQLRICTPRDLVLWRSSVPELTAKVNEQLQQRPPAQSSAEAAPEPFTEEQMSWSMRRAQKYRKKYAWLDDWITDL